MPDDNTASGFATFVSETYAKLRQFQPDHAHIVSFVPEFHSETESREIVGELCAITAWLAAYRDAIALSVSEKHSAA